MRNPAESYEDYVVPALFSPWASRLVTAAALQPGERVLDVACGTGIVARKAAERPRDSAHIVGADPNPLMLSIARSRAEREGSAVEWHQAPAEALPFPDRSFDVVLCQQGLQFFSDREAGLTEIHRVLRPGGRLLLTVWQGLHHHAFFGHIDRAVQEHFGVPAIQAPFSFGDANQLRRMLDDAGLECVEVASETHVSSYPDPSRFLTETLDGIRAITPSLQERSEADWADLVAAVADELAEPLSEVTQDEHVLVPWTANCARAARREQ